MSLKSYFAAAPKPADPAAVWTVCVTTFTVRVVVEGDSSPPPVAAQKAGGKATGGKAKQPKASGGKAGRPLPSCAAQTHRRLQAAARRRWRRHPLGAGLEQKGGGRAE